MRPPVVITVDGYRLLRGLARSGVWLVVVMFVVYGAFGVVAAVVTGLVAALLGWLTYLAVFGGGRR